MDNVPPDADNDRRHTRQPSAPSSAGQRWWLRLLDGDHVWGSLDVSPTRYGVTRYCLVIFPPGIDRLDRRLLRALRAWPTWGALLWLFSVCLLSTSSISVRFAVPTAVWLGIGAVLFAYAGALRTQVRTRCVTRIAGHPDITCRPDEESANAYAEMTTSVGMLRSADVLRAQGRLSTAEHEAIWWQVYDRLAPGRGIGEDR